MTGTGKLPLHMMRAALLAVLAASAAIAGLAHGADAAEEPWKVDVYYENDTHFRGKDNTGNTVGLSKFRNTLQAEADKHLSGGWSFHGIFRGTWDGVYRLNKDEFGESAGSKSADDVRIENTAGPVAASVGLGLPPVHLRATVPFGGGIGFTVVDAIQGQAGLSLELFSGAGRGGRICADRPGLHLLNRDRAMHAIDHGDDPSKVLLRRCRRAHGKGGNAGQNGFRDCHGSLPV